MPLAVLPESVLPSTLTVDEAALPIPAPLGEVFDEIVVLVTANVPWLKIPPPLTVAVLVSMTEPETVRFSAFKMAPPLLAFPPVSVSPLILTAAGAVGAALPSSTLKIRTLVPPLTVIMSAPGPVIVTGLVIFNSPSV